MLTPTASKESHQAAQSLQGNDCKFVGNPWYSHETPLSDTAVHLQNNMHEKPWKPPLSVREKHPRIMHHRQYSPKIQMKSSFADHDTSMSPEKPRPLVYSKNSLDITSIPYVSPSLPNRSLQTIPADNQTIISNLDCSKGSALNGSLSDLSSSSASRKNAALDEYMAMLEVSGKQKKDRKDKIKNSMENKAETVTDTRTLSVSADYHSLLKGTRKTKISVNQSKLDDYAKHLSGDPLSTRKNRKQKKETPKIQATPLTKHSSETRTTCPSDTTVSLEGVSELTDKLESNSPPPTTSVVAIEKNKFKLEPICLSSTSLKKFQKYSTATNDPNRAQKIHEQMLPSTMKLEKLARPKKEADEWTGLITTKESRLRNADQTNASRYRNFDELLMTSESCGRII